MCILCKLITTFESQHFKQCPLQTTKRYWNSSSVAKTLHNILQYLTIHSFINDDPVKLLGSLIATQCCAMLQLVLFNISAFHSCLTKHSPHPSTHFLPPLVWSHNVPGSPSGADTIYCAQNHYITTVFSLHTQYNKTHNVWVVRPQLLSALQCERSQGSAQRPQDPLEIENTKKENYNHVTTTNK